MKQSDPLIQNSNFAWSGCFSCPTQGLLQPRGLTVRPEQPMDVTTLRPLVLQPMFLTLHAWSWRHDGTGVRENEYDEGKFSSTDYFVSLLSQCFLAGHVFVADMQGLWGLRPMPLPHSPPFDGQPLASVCWPSYGVSFSSAWSPLACRNFASLSCCWWKCSLSLTQLPLFALPIARNSMGCHTVSSAWINYQPFQSFKPQGSLKTSLA